MFVYIKILYWRTQKSPAEPFKRTISQAPSDGDKHYLSERADVGLALGIVTEYVYKKD